MKKTTKSGLRNFVVKTQDMLTHLSTEPTTQQETPIATSVPNPSSPPPRPKKAKHPDGPQEKKSKKRRIPFIALALVLLFANLCVLCFVGKQPLAWATSLSSSTTLHHSNFTSLQDVATPATNCIVIDCYGDPATPDPLGAYPYSLKPSCSNTYATKTSDQFCWNDADFQWANRDITCIKNSSLDIQQKNFNARYGQNFGPSTLPNTTNGTPASTGQNPGAASGLGDYNQNTCTNNSTCYTDNRSNSPPDDPLIHDLTGGDDIICFNNACIGKGGSSTNPNCGGLPYDKFACSPIATGSSWYFNPTTYNPSGDLEETNKDLKVNGYTDPSGDNPACDGGQWRCTGSGADTIVLAMEPNNTGDLDNFFTNNPEEIKPTTSTDYSAPAGTGGGQGGGGSNTDTATWNYPPAYQVGCHNIGSNWIFPCSDKPNGGGVNEPVLQNDWLSGNVGVTTGGNEKYPAHLEVTYADETHALPHLMSLSSLTLALGYTLTIPALILIGYQLLWSSWTFRRVATMEMVARLLLSIVAVSVSYELTTMLIGLSNAVSHGVILLHSSLGYPDINLNGTNLTYILDGEQGDPSSFRGIVVPISRWGCTMNDFMEILSEKLTGDIVGFLPFVGGPAKLGIGISDAIKAFKDIGEFAELLLSINLCIQIFIRIALVNYYILTAPIALGCWGLPGTTGQRIVNQWFKGFCSILFTQAIQLFVLTTMPWLLPPLPQLPTDTMGILYTILTQLPRVIVLLAVIKVPAMLGSGATKAMARAGTMGSGAVTAIAGAAYSVV